MKWPMVVLFAAAVGCGAGAQKTGTKTSGQAGASQGGQGSQAAATTKDNKKEPAPAPLARRGDAPKKRGEKLDEFKDNKSGKPGLSRGETASEIRPTRTEAALKFTVIDRAKKRPISGIVISLTDPKGLTFYTKETDGKGYAEVLVPVGRTYKVVYLSLGRRKIAARLPVENKPSLTMRLTLRYKRFVRKMYKGKPVPQKFVLSGIEFDTGKATIRRRSYGRLDQVVEYMAHKLSARIRIAGHTDNVGRAKKNKVLSLRRAKACRAYLIKKGIDGSRIEAVGYGSEQPVASNDSKEGRQRNRRIEAIEL
ncbi:MAG: OmpA family protein [Myxococcales bacterium]|nr:OmpA family protein [Myxococcales bacterium]